METGKGERVGGKEKLAGAQAGAANPLPTGHRQPELAVSDSRVLILFTTCI